MIITRYICLLKLATQNKLSTVEAKAKNAEKDALQLLEKNAELKLSLNRKDDDLKVNLCMHAFYW